MEVARIRITARATGPAAQHCLAAGAVLSRLSGRSMDSLLALPCEGGRLLSLGSAPILAVSLAVARAIAMDSAAALRQD